MITLHCFFHTQVLLCIASVRVQTSSTGTMLRRSAMHALLFLGALAHAVVVRSCAARCNSHELLLEHANSHSQDYKQL